MKRRSFLGSVAAFAASDWKPLFDGKSFANWRDPSRLSPPGDSWHIAEGCLVAKREPQLLEDLETVEHFTFFEFAFEWRLGPDGNSGVKYAIEQRIFFENSEPGWVKGKRVTSRKFSPGTRGQQYLKAKEFQLVDDSSNQDALQGEDRKTGSIYRRLARQSAANAPINQWNRGLLRKLPDRVEHEVNGAIVLSSSTYPKTVSDWHTPSPIALQNHADSEVRFRNLQIRIL
jgi:hypothetical protein